MSRRPANPSRRFADSGVVTLVSSLQSKSRASPFLSAGLLIMEEHCFLSSIHIATQVCISSVPSAKWQTVGMNCGFSSSKVGVSRLVEGDFSCTLEVTRAIPVLKKAYGDSIRKVLHVGPDSCYVASHLLKEEDTEAWGIEPYDIEDADRICTNLVSKGIVRVADIKFPLPYRAKSFSLVIVSDALDYLSPKYLNRTVPDLARISTGGLVILAGYPGHLRAKDADISKFGVAAKLRSSSWWIRYFAQTTLEENGVAIKKFEQAAMKKSYQPSCQIFHLKSYP